MSSRLPLIALSVVKVAHAVTVGRGAAARAGAVGQGPQRQGVGPSSAVAVGSEVTYQGATYTCRQAQPSQAGWIPPATLALWSQVVAALALECQ